jgi:hypothetical protein
VVIIPVAVEKLGFSEKSRKSGDRKCPGDWRKSFAELPDAIQFFQIPSERVFQQPRPGYQQLPPRQTMNYTFDSAFYSQTHTIEEFLEFGALDGGFPAYRPGHN